MLAAVGERSLQAHSLALALVQALAAGALSFFSPCRLPLAPGYLSYVTGTSGAGAAEANRRTARWRVLAGRLLFVVGFAAVFTSYRALTIVLGPVFAVPARCTASSGHDATHEL